MYHKPNPFARSSCKRFLALHSNDEQNPGWPTTSNNAHPKLTATAANSYNISTI
jgi:hypothetical protein